MKEILNILYYNYIGMIVAGTIFTGGDYLDSGHSNWPSIS